MYNYVDHRGFKTFLKHIFSVFLIFTLYFNTISAYAGAAEKWEYEPVMKNMNIEVKAHKVDQYGAAVNDYEYNTKIDPKTAPNKAKMGTVGMGRLLRSSGWGLVGSVALEALLNSVDWVLDQEAQSIWRNKKPEGSSYQCIYLDSTGKNKYMFRAMQASGVYHEFPCPGDAAKKLLEILKQYQGIDSTFVEFTPPLTTTLVRSGVPLNFKALRKYSDGSTVEELRSISTKTVPYTAPNPEKEYLTPEQLADYANHTHPDYSNPELAPKLEPKYSPKIAEDLWKPSNDWEKQNSPTVKEVERKLDQTQPEPKKDAEIKPNPETGGSVLPSFCSWAAPVCEFIKDAKEFVKDDTPEDLDNDPPEIKDIPIGSLDTSTFKGTPGCPSPIQVPVTFAKSGTVEISYEPICAMASKWSFVAPFIGFFSGALIILGVGRKGEDSDT